MEQASVMQASKLDLQQIGLLLGLELGDRQTTEEMLDAIKSELYKIQQAANWMFGASITSGDSAPPGHPSERLATICRQRLDAFYAGAREKKFKRVRPA